jgi:hypothetical protein
MIGAGFGAAVLPRTSQSVADSGDARIIDRVGESSCRAVIAQHLDGRRRGVRHAPTRRLRAGRTTARRTASSFRPRSGASGTGRSPDACTSPQNADLIAASAQLVCITHPFHPFAGRQLVCVGERYNRFGKRLLLRIDNGTICSVPPQWTDAIAPDPEVVVGQGRALFRVVDLMGLALLVERISAERRSDKM